MLFDTSDLELLLLDGLFVGVEGVDGVSVLQNPLSCRWVVEGLSELKSSLGRSIFSKMSWAMESPDLTWNGD